MPVYNAGTPGKMVALYLLMLSSTSFKSRTFGTMTMLAPDDMEKFMPATMPYTWKRGMPIRVTSAPSLRLVDTSS